MKQRLLLLLAPFFILSAAPASFAQSGGVEVLGNWTNPDLPAHSFGFYNEIWGIEVNGHEYGVIGSVRGTHFIDLETNPLQEVYFIAGRDSVGNNIHRDYHSFGQYLYAVCDEGESSLQIMDFSDLPNKVSLVYDSQEFMVTSHNIFIDEDNARLYTTNTFNWFLSLADPIHPVKVDLNTSGPRPPAQHDLYVRDNIAYLNCQGDGLFICDVSNPDEYVMVGSLSNYPNQGYNHSGWLNDEGTHYFLCEETTGADLKTIDVTDPGDLQIKKRFNVGTPYANLPHNSMIRGDYLYVSYYYDGLQVYDISDPENPFRVAFFDSYDGPNGGFRGAWGVYSKLPSGRILLSDMTYGLFLLEVTPGFYSTEATLKSISPDLVYCDNLEEVVFEIEIGEGFDDSGVALEVSDLPAGAEIVFSANPASPGTTVTATLSGVSENFDFEITAIDALNNSYYLEFTVETKELPLPTPLLEPANTATNVGPSPHFAWDGSLFNIYLLEIATDETDFEGSVLFVQVIFNARDFDLPVALDMGRYFWRLSTDNECGRVYSEVFEFSTGTVGVGEIEKALWTVFPNPARGQVTITVPANPRGMSLKLLDVQGKTIINEFIPAQQNQWNLLVEEMTGVFCLQLETEGKLLTQKVVLIP